MNVRFFASPIITLYMARMFVTRFAAVLAALVIILLALDLLGESGDILAYPGNGEAQIWHYLSLRAPQIVARFLPFSALLATLITLATLNQHSEIIAMKAAGISAHQILAPLVMASIGIAALSFWFNDHVVARSTYALNAWQAADYGPVVRRSAGAKTNVWVRDGDDLIRAASVTGSREQVRLQGVSVYDREGGELARIVQGDVAVRVSGEWSVRNARLFDVATGRETTVADYRMGKGATPDRFTLSSVDPNEMSFGALLKAIGDLKAAGRPTEPLESGLWHKISGPMSAILMPLLAGVAAFGTARSGQLFIRAVIGMALGFLYFVADNFALAMGNIGAYPPLLAAWAPFALFLLIGETVLIRTEE
ncbi:MAG: LPS export ABC transporter permease LptG [Sphingomonadaceae bacterium]